MTTSDPATLVSLSSEASVYRFLHRRFLSKQSPSFYLPRGSSTMTWSCLCHFLKAMGASQGKRTPQNSPHNTSFQSIPDRFETLEEVSEALRRAGLEASQLIVGVDYTKSNTWTGRRTFEGRCLHDISGPPNPYLVALSLIARTLESFDDDHMIPCYGFGDVTTKGESVFSFFPGNEPANGLEGLLLRYRQITPYVDLSGPTSFAPLIRQAMRHVYYTDMEYHILLIVADGQISAGCLADTKQAIVDASNFPISIVMVGVGDGPWDGMIEFDDELPQRNWDNFQFVEFDKIIKNPALINEQRREASFALNALMEIPDQCKHAQKLLGAQAKARVQRLVSTIPPNVLIDPPPYFDAK